MRRGDAAFERYTVLAILIAPSWAAGSTGVPASIYVVVNLISAALWAAGGSGAYFVGPPIIDVVGDLGSITEAILAVVVMLGAVAGLRRWLRVRRRRRDATDAKGSSETS